jgi:hypothetical protein
MISSTTVHGLEIASASRSKPTQPKMGNKVMYGGARRKTDSELLQLPVINVPEPNIELVKVSLQMVSLMFVKWIVSLKTSPFSVGKSLAVSFSRACHSTSQFVSNAGLLRGSHEALLHLQM